MVAWGALLLQEGDEGGDSMEDLRAELGGCRETTFIHFLSVFLGLRSLCLLNSSSDVSGLVIYC